MPGTGHSARYKGSISNRSKVSPFEQLAKWNQELLGADGMVPSITGGGGSLEFKKLNASDIDGVMTNPANLSIPSGGSLDMSALNITNCNQINTKFISDVQQITNNQDITINTGKNFRLSSGGGGIFSGTDINIGHPADQSGNINIGWSSSTNTVNNVNIGHSNPGTGNKSVNIMTSGGTGLTMGSSNNLVFASVNSLQTRITGTNQLNLFGGQIKIGANALATTKLGFFGHGPITRPDVELTSPADTALERSTKINNFMIKLSNSIGVGLGLITTS